jgi:hypothetical protein
MKLLDNNFDDYLNEKKKNKNIHVKIQKIYDCLSNNIKDMNNIILYGPAGIGKYTQSLLFIEKFSPSNLKYQKKLTITYNKLEYFFKISDVHFEIDMSILGCISKLLWNEIYLHIIDILLARTNKVGIILCKNFHTIHNELLEIFYSYMQKNYTNIELKFIIISEHISFIPNNIIKNCEIINISKPSNAIVKKTFNLKNNDNISDTNNLKNLIYNIPELKDISKNFINNIYNLIVNYNTEFKYITFRDIIYDIFIYDININDFIWKLNEKLMDNNHIKDKHVNTILINTYNFYQLYNNNYRAIYHVENYLLKIISIIHSEE